MILVRFNTLSLEQIYVALKNERYGVYEAKTPSYNDFNAIYLSEILNKFKKHIQSRRMHLKIKPLQEEPKKLLSENDKEAIMKRAFENAKNDLQEHGEFTGAVTHIYDWIDEKGKMPTKKEYKLKVKQRAIISIRQKKEINRKKDGSFSSRSMKVLESITQNQNGELVTECKRLALKDFIKNNPDFQ